MADHSKVIKCSDYEWESVSRKEYKEGKSCYRDVHRYSLLGEKDNERQLNFQTRYFEVSPNGYTSFEVHRHPHSIVVIRGSGSVILGDHVHELGLHDVVYIAPETMHQFHADNGEPFGFICIVDRYRDRPVLPDDEMIKSTVKSPNAREKIKR